MGFSSIAQELGVEERLIERKSHRGRIESQRLLRCGISYLGSALVEAALD
jgi:hypothetical protein